MEKFYNVSILSFNLLSYLMGRRLSCISLVTSILSKGPYAMCKEHFFMPKNKTREGRYVMAIQQRLMILDVDDKPAPLKGIFLGLQHVFAMFGATILVPILLG